MSSHRVLFFDIDGTLLDTGGAGGAALLDAVEELYGVARHTLPPLNLAGATDKGVVRELFLQLQASHSDVTVTAYLERYLHHLDRRLGCTTFAGRLLPGVRDLLTALKATGQAHLGLLTGNIRRGAMLKLQRFGIDHHFVDGAFGDDAEDRNLLGAVAVERLTAATGKAYPPSAAIVIGDTPKDIACAAAAGLRCLAVGTGVYSAEQLRACSPWACLESLADTDRVCDLLLS